MFKVILLAFLSLTALDSVNAQNCPNVLNAKMSASALNFMKQHDLIHDGEELDFPAIGIKTKWDSVRVEPIPNGCVAVMALCTFQGPQGAQTKTCDDGPFEVLGLKFNHNIPIIVPFESVYPVPKEVIAKIGTAGDVTDPSFYYVKFANKSALAAVKSVVAKISYGGFSGNAVLGGKAPFDPTANRNWQISIASFDLRRGMTAEVLDIQSWQLDGLDAEGAAGTWNGCMKVNEKHGTCSVAPWAQSYIRELLPAK